MRLFCMILLSFKVLSAMLTNDISLYLHAL
jgi:hypothetical protein